MSMSGKNASKLNYVMKFLNRKRTLKFESVDISFSAYMHFVEGEGREDSLFLFNYIIIKTIS